MCSTCSPACVPCVHLMCSTCTPCIPIFVRAHLFDLTCIPIFVRTHLHVCSMSSIQCHCNAHNAHCYGNMPLMQIRALENYGAGSLRRCGYNISLQQSEAIRAYEEPLLIQRLIQYHPLHSFNIFFSPPQYVLFSSSIASRFSFIFLSRSISCITNSLIQYPAS